MAGLASGSERSRFVASQLGVTATTLNHYTRRPETRRQHLLDIEAHLGWRRHNRGDLKADQAPVLLH